MPENVPFNQRHAHLFKEDLKKAPIVAEPFTQQLSSEIPFGRYDKIFYGINNEELYAQRQSALDQLANGAAKMAGTFTTSFLSGTVGLINGIGQYASTGKFSSFYDNDFNRSLDNLNTLLEDKLPNYYTQAEKDAEWYSPTNIFSANFFGDKVLKNLGYSFGALAGGMGWGTALRAIGLTSKLIRAGQGLKTIEAVEGAMANAPKLQQFGAINRSLNSLWQGAKNAAGTALTNSERAIISSTGMLGEATIEALQSTNDFRNKLIQDYKNLYGTAPTGDNLDEINSYAESVGKTVFGSNAVLLTLSNYIQLPKILGSSKSAEKRMINNIAKEGVDPTSKFVTEVPSTGNVLSPVANLLGKPGRLMNKYVLGPGRLTFSVGEAFEEGAQYAIQVGTQDYFERASKNSKETESILNGIGGVLGNIFEEGVKRALTDKEGLESILIGGFSGGLQKIIENIKERGISGTGGTYGRNTQLALQALNNTNIKEALQDGVRYGGIAIGSQKLRQQAIQNNDVLNEKDFEKDYELSYILPRVKYGKLDSILQEVQYYREQLSSDNGFQDLLDNGIALPGETKEKFLKKLDSLEQTAKSVNKIYESIDEKYSGIMINDKPVYSPIVIDKLAYAAAKVVDYDGRIPNLTPKLIAAGIDVDTVVKDVVEGKIESFNDAIDTIKGMKNLTADQQEDLGQALEDVAEMSIRRDKFLKEYNEIKKSPENFKDYEREPEEEAVPIQEKKETIKVKVKNREKEVELGTEYYLGKGVDYDKDGLEVPVEISMLTILGENEDGTIKIKDSKGETRDVSKAVLEDYKLFKASELRSNKTANYFYRHRNEIFEYNFGKEYGGKKQGRIEYDNGNLFFVYRNDKGKIQRKKIDNSHFVAQEGYNEARVKKVGEIENEEQRVAREEFTSTEEIAKQKETLAKNRDARLEIITQLETETRTRLEEVNKKLDNKKKELDGIQKDLNKIGDEVRVAEPRTKREKSLEAKYPELSRQKIRFNKVFSTTSKALSKLSRMREDVQDEINKLTAEKNELEFNLSYFEDFGQNLDELPENSGEFLKELKNQVKWIDMLIKETGDNINTLSKLSKTIENAIKDFVSLLDDSLKKFDENYPDYIKDKLADIEGGNFTIKNFAELKEYLADYALLEDLQKEISVSENKLQNVEDQVKNLYEQLEQLGNEHNAKKQILDRFQAVADAYLTRKAEEEKLMKNQQLLDEALGTADTSVQTVEYDKEFEPTAKKSDEIIPRATMGVNRGKPHQVRANTFGFNLNKFENRKNIRGVYVTSKNEDQLIPGLTDLLRTDEAGQLDEDIKKDEIIAMVMVEEDADGKIVLVGEDGQPIPEGADPLETAVFQVFPDGNLEWGAEFNNESMFRKDTPQEVKDSITKQYKAWRSSVLENPDLSQRHEIEASFGRVEDVRDADGKVVYDTRTSVQDANLITADDLEATPLITIPTLPTEGNNVATVSKGTVTFKVPVGTVLLETPNGLVKLQNKQNGEKQAEVIYSAILQVAKNMLDPQIGVKSPESERLFNWLRSVVYWGLPKDQNENRKPAGYNSVFFEKDEATGKLMLTISGKGKDFVFTPSSLEDNRETIILMLSNMYNNINSHMSKQLNEPYEEILSISETGEITSRTWKNYQSYLLSNTTPDGKKRTGEELPLSTRIRPAANENDINRTNIYFYTTDTADDFVIPVVERKKVVTPRVLTPGGPTAVTPAVTEEEVVVVPETEPIDINLSEIEFLSDEKLLSLDNPKESITLQKKLKDDFEDVKSLLKCLLG